MTLLYTEVSHEFPGRGRCVLFAADRRITPFGVDSPRHYKKLVDIPYLNAALGFFGLAEFSRDGTLFRMVDHLRDFVRKEHAAFNLSAFAAKLAASLNTFIPSSLRASERSGIHLAGITSGALPEFWFVRNVDESGSPTLGQYKADEQFLARDAAAEGFDGQNPQTLPLHGRLYQNGDILAHVAALKALDDTLGTVLRVRFFLESVRRRTTPIGFASRWKFWFISIDDSRSAFSSAVQ